ncbi:hypothetical protein WMW72_16355 [Paenibacillus filicis]|uniref:Uncharacterized protein n=1 Tax=Paenibacillus filicis TaxID=669464 RepID=A0ABU9DL31_9BACL
MANTQVKAINPQKEKIDPGVLKIALILVFGAIASQLDSTMVNVAINTLAVTLVASIPFAFAWVDTNHFLLGAAQLVRGAALNGILIPILVSSYKGLRKEQIPHASISTRIFQTIGGAFGSAILATVIGQQLKEGAGASLSSLAHAYQTAFWWSVGFAAISFLPAMFLSGRENKV